MKIVSRNIGRCLTEYKREDYDQIVKNYAEFIMISQFIHPKPKTLDEALVDRHSRLRPTPQCGYGEHMFGVEKDGTLTELISIIDSSD